jgi:two-component system phosphate regulon sensor histidine kinase PhoR
LVYSRIFLKLYAGFVIVILFSTAIVSLMISNQMQQDSLIEFEKSLSSQASILRESVRPTLLSGQVDSLQARMIQMTRDVDTRVTVISKEGAVLADTDQDPLNMDNHQNRPEIQEAFELGIGIETRYSLTLSKPMRYLALPIYDNQKLLAYIRVALPLSLIDQSVARLRNVVFVAAFITSIIALFIGFWIARNFAHPLRQMTDMAQGVTEGDYQQYLEIDRRDELGDLALALNQMATTLRKVETIRRDFVANASHELKTPLTAIRGFTETMLDDVDMEENTRQDFLEKIRGQTLRLSDLASDLLSLSRIESKGTAAFSQIDLGETIKKCLSALQITAGEKKQSLKIFVPEEKVNIFADENAISQLMNNLVENASKYTAEGGSISAILTTSEKLVIIKVEDNGIGIDALEHQRIFERFYRVDKSHSQLSAGTGLGLSIVKHIVVMLKGDISVVSKLGSGTVFRISLPLANS